MNLMSARVALRDRTLLDVMDLALRFVAAHKGSFVKMSAWVCVPGFVVSWLFAEAGGWYVGWLATFAIASFAEAPFVALASRLVFQDSVPTREALRAGLAATPRLFGVRILQGLTIFAGSFIFLLPGLWLAALFFFATEVIVLEQSTVGAAVGRLQKLGTGYFGDVFMAMLLVWCLYAAALFLGDATGSAVLEGLLQIRVHPSEEQVGGPLALFGLWLALPFLTTARFFVYLNLRTRREGWDIQTRFAAIAARAAHDDEAP